MRKKLVDQIRAARPSLRLVSPISYWFVILMGVFNILIGIAFITSLGEFTNDLALRAVSKIIPFDMWGFLFILLGVAKLYSIITNSWGLARYSLLAGVLLKSAWAVALVIRSFYAEDGLFTTYMWISIAITQIICYIYFLPPTEPRYLNGAKVKDE